MGKSKRIYTFILLFILLILSSVLLLGDVLWKRKDIKTYKVSVIIRGKNTETWMIMKEGIDQAASEMNVEISFVTLSEENSASEQMELIQREIKNGSDAILISPVDYKLMKTPIEKASKKIPIILIESTIESEKYIPYIACDNYQLGSSLAEEMMRNGNTRVKVAIIRNNLVCSSIKEKYDGFMDTANSTKNIYSFLDVSEERTELYEEVKKIIIKNSIDVIVTFDTEILEVIGKVKKDIENEKKEKIKIELYGTGSTNKIISYLEEEIINGTAVQNEFNVGYLGIKTAVDMIRDKDIDKADIFFTVVNSRNMYSSENQRLLFPFVR